MQGQIFDTSLESVYTCPKIMSLVLISSSPMTMTVSLEICSYQGLARQDKSKKEQKEVSDSK